MPDLRSLCKRFIALPLLIGISSLGAALPANAQSQCHDDCDWNRWMCVEDCRQWAGPSAPWNPNNYCYDDCDDNYNACIFACDTPPSDETVINNRLHEMISPVLGRLQDPQFRNLVYAGVARRFDGDDNVLLSHVIIEAEQAQIVDPNSPAWQSFKAQVASFQDVNGTAYEPQIYIPYYQDGALPTPDVTMVVMETNPSYTSVPAYQWVGGSQQYIGHVNEAYSEGNEVFVLSVNESMNNEGSSGACYPPPTGGSTGCSGSRFSGGREFLVSLQIPNPQQYEHWTAGALELRVIIVGKGGVELRSHPFQKIKRKKLRAGYTDERLFVTTWDRALWGDYMIYKWIEIDRGPKVQLNAGISIDFLKLIKASAGLTLSFEPKNYDIGSAPVLFTEAIQLPYSTGTTDSNGTPLTGVHWRVCNEFP